MKDDSLTGGRLWSAGAKEKRQPLPQEPPAGHDKVVPLFPPDRAYAAFKIAEHTDRLQIDRANQPSRFPSYHYLLDMNFDPLFQVGFTLFYTTMEVEVTGEYLWPVVHAIKSGKCDSIHEFSPKLYDAPEPGKPIITGITFRPPGSGIFDELAKREPSR